MSSRVAIFLHHGLGDLLCALPSLAAADAKLGSAGALDIVVKSKLEASVIQELAWQGQVSVFTLRSTPLLARLFETLWVALTLRRRRPSLLLTPHIRSAKSASAIARIIGAETSIIPAGEGLAATASDQHLSMRPGEHKVEYYSRYFATLLDLGQGDRLEFPSLPRRASPLAGGPRIVLAPAVGALNEQHKRWPKESFVTLADEIARKWPSATIELFAPKPDLDLLECIAAEVSDATRARLAIATPDTPLEAAAHLVGAHCVVTPCSGASHLAAWAGAPVVGLYGPTNPHVTGPYTRQLYIVRTQLPCSPCYRPDFISGCGAPICMSGLGVESVLLAMNSALQGDRPPQLEMIVTTNATKASSDSVQVADDRQETLS